MDDSPRQGDIGLSLKAVDAVYDCVFEPARYGAIIDTINALFDETLGADGDMTPIEAQLAWLGPHMMTALRLFEVARPEAGGRLRDLLNGKPFAAMAVTERGRVVMMNDTAGGMLGALETVAELPLRADAHANVADFLAGAGRSEVRGPVVVSGWHPTEDRALLFVLETIDSPWRVFCDIDAQRLPKGPLILVKSTETRLSPAVWNLMASAFDLTTAEIDVVRELTNGLSLKEISQRRARSPNTIKTQLMSVLRKTGVRSQGQLLCMVTALAHVAEAEDGIAPGDPLCTPLRGMVSLHSADLADGRPQKYVVAGARNGRPVLLLTPTCRPDFTPAIVDAFADRNLTVICPVRPGSWGAPRLQKWEPRRAVRDYLSLLDRLSLGRVVLAGLRAGAPYAVELAHQAPERFAGLVLLDTGAPLVSMAKFAAMPPWPRTLYTTARLGPDLLLLPFRYSASDFAAGAEGEVRAVRAYYRDSPLDLALLRDPKFYEFARRNLAYYFENPDQISRDIAHWVSDWSPQLRDVCGRMPVRFVHGAENTSFLASDVLAFCRETPGASASIVEGVAMSLIYLSPERVAEELSRAADGDAAA